jgi:hypothetical protein
MGMGRSVERPGHLRAVDERDHDEVEDERGGGHRRQRAEERRVGDAGGHGDEHVLRVAGGRRDRAEVGGGGEGEQVGERPHAQRRRHLEDQRRQREAHRVVDEEGGEQAGHDDEGGQELTGRPRPPRHRHARPAEEPGQLQVRDHDHHPEQQDDGAEVHHAEGLLRRDHVERDHEGGADHRRARAVQAQPGHAPQGDDDVGGAEDDGGGQGALTPHDGEGS